MDYINTYLKKIYNETNIFTPIQYISLESNQNTLFSYMTLLIFHMNIMKILLKILINQ